MDDPDLQFGEVKKAERSFNESQKQRADLNEIHRQKLAEYYDKLALYSASALSFTVTLIGFLFTNKNLLPIYKSTLLSLPIVYFIYGGWILLAYSLTAALISRKMDAHYISDFGHYQYLKKGKDFEEKRIEFIEKYPELKPFDLSNAELPGWLKGKKEFIEKLPAALKKSEKNRDFYFFMLRWLRNTSEITALIGTLLILIFGILSSQRILFGV